METRQRGLLAAFMHFIRRSALAGISLAGLLLATCEARAGLTIYMSATSDRIDQVTPPNPRTTFAQLGLPFGVNPEGVVFDPLSNLFVASANDVSKITPSGMVSFFATLPSGAGGDGIAIDPSVNLYVADASVGEISKIDPGGTVTTYATFGFGFGSWGEFSGRPDWLGPSRWQNSWCSKAFGRTLRVPPATTGQATTIFPT